MISREEVLHLAELARLKIADAEIASLQKDISSVLEYVGHVSAVSVSDKKVTPFIKKVTPFIRNVMREDAPRGAGDPMADKEEALRAAFPQREGDYNVVRKIIQKDE